MSFDLFLTGFVVGLCFVTIFATLDGLFGEWLLHGVVVVLSVLFVTAVFATSPETAAADLEPWPYWLGLFAGLIAGRSVASDIRQTLTDDRGRPLVKQWLASRAAE